MNGLDTKQHIEGIFTKYDSSPELVLDSLTGAIETLQKVFPRRGHFLMEFIQNADDAESQSIRIEITQNIVKIMNDGFPFSKEDVESICKIGRSSKMAEDYIGYLGVGFKSVFLISECPQIYSGNYQFKFDKNHWPSPKHTPWQVIPIWIDESDVSIPFGKYKTIFILPIGKEIDREMAEKIKEETTPVHLSNRVLLFLRNLKEIEIYDQNRNTRRKIVKSENVSLSQEYEIYTLEEYENDVLKQQDHWLLFRSLCDVPDEVKRDPITKDWEREWVKRREVLIALELDEENNLQETVGTAHIGVFSFLPLKEVPSGLKFLVQADFLTAPGREVILREALWNKWLAKEIFNLIVQKCIPALLNDEKWRTRFTDILWPGEWGHPIFDEYIKGPLRNYLESNPVLITTDGSPISVREAVSLEPNVRKLLSESDLKMLFPDKKILHPDSKVPWDLESKITKGPAFNAAAGLSDKMLELLKLKAEQGDLEFFKQFYKELSSYAESTIQRSPLKNQDIILTDKKELVDSTKVYVKLEDVIVPPEIESNFKIVHPEILKDYSVSEFLVKLHVQKLTNEHVQNILKEEEFFKISKNWKDLSDEDKIHKLKLCKELWEKHQIDSRDLGFLTLKSKSGKWLSPSELLFSKEYNPGHEIESIVEKGLLDLPIEFTDAEFIESKKEIESWREFFKVLGVDGKLEKEKSQIVERIGILTALRFEREHGREPRELGESEKFLGYDIESRSSSEERYIEVKGSHESDPSIFLTPREFKALQDKWDKYFVYVVKDVFRKPLLRTNKGNKLLGITDINVIINFNKWWIISGEEFQP